MTRRLDMPFIKPLASPYQPLGISFGFIGPQKPNVKDSPSNLSVPSPIWK